MATAKDFLALFPQTRTNVATGGNCTAWSLLLANGLLVLLTTPEDALQPEETDTEVMVGVEDGDGPVVVDGLPQQPISWQSAIEIVTNVSKHAHPDVVDDVGHDHGGPTPYYCTNCGEECEDGSDCCSDEFPEAGEMRETGR